MPKLGDRMGEAPYEVEYVEKVCRDFRAIGGHTIHGCGSLYHGWHPVAWLDGAVRDNEDRIVDICGVCLKREETQQSQRFATRPTDTAPVPRGRLTPATRPAQEDLL